MDDIKSMIKSRRDERYHGSAYNGQMNKAITDHKEKLLPILNKLRNNEPLTPEERKLVYKIADMESMKANENIEMYRKPAFEDGIDYVNRSLDAGVDPKKLQEEIRDKAYDLDRRADEQWLYHTSTDPESPISGLQNTIRYAADNMGTAPRALAADEAKREGMSVGGFRRLGVNEWLS